MKHTLSTLVENKPGVLARVAGLFSRRGYNIASLAVSTTENPAVSRMTIVVDDEGKPGILEQISKQLYKLIDVIRVSDHTDEPIVESELTLIKVRADSGTRSEIVQLAEIFRARIVDVNHDTLMLEATGKAEKLDALMSVLEPFGIHEVARSGKIVLARGRKTT
ncbi:MAG: acetolactate synthase small subunit [Armatimonadota bacterium]